MSSLTLDEILEIKHILTEYFKDCEKPGEHLKSLIKIGKIQIDTAEIYSSTNVRELIPNFYGKIVYEHQQLLLFLKVFQGELYELSDERLKIQEYIKKLHEAHLSKTSLKRSHINELFDNERETTSSQVFNDQAAIKIDNTIIIDYDLHELKSEFRLGYGGIFAFTIVGDDTILRNYIIKRIIKELDKRPYRPPIEIMLSDTYSTIQEQIESHLQNCADSFNDNQYLDTLLIIWNYSLNQDKSSSIAHHLLSRIHQEYCQYLEKKSKCLIIILANVSTPCQLNGYTPLTVPQINGYTPLTVPQRFEIDDLSKWFYRCLIENQIEEVVIEQYLERLKGQQGHLTATYRMIEQIIIELQDGRLSL